MNQSYLENETDCRIPSVPKARPPIRQEEFKETDFPVNMNLQNSKTINSMYYKREYRYNSTDSLTSNLDNVQNNDEDDDEDIENENDNTYRSNDLSEVNDSLLDSFSTAQNSPYGMRSQERSRCSSVVKTIISTSSTQKQNTRKGESKDCKNSHPFLFTTVAVLVIACFVFYVHGRNKETFNESHSQAQLQEIMKKAEGLDRILNKSIKKVRTQFHNQKPNIWNDIASGIYDVLLYPNRPSIIVLFGNETDVINCLAQLLGKISGHIIGSDDYQMLTPRDFGNDLGEVIYNLKLLVPEKRVIVVQDLLSINTEAIKAFHNLCDRENPLVGHAIYIITVLASGYEPAQKELEFIEKVISKSLSGKIEKDILDPLVTRITDGVVVPVLSEPTMHNHCFSL